jgi:hypothetical protein
VDSWRDAAERAIQKLEQKVKRDQERLDLMRQQLEEYDARKYEVFECEGIYPREAAPMLLKHLNRPVTAGEVIERLLEGNVKVGTGRPEVNVRIALTILVKSGKLLCNRVNALSLSVDERNRLMVKDSDLLSLP